MLRSLRELLQPSFVSACAFASISCGSEPSAKESPSISADSSKNEQTGQKDSSTHLQLPEFQADPSVEKLLGLLQRDHEDTRFWGSHRLRSTSKLSISPEGPLPRPKVGERTSKAYNIESKLELKWRDFEKGFPNFHLQKSNNHDRSWEVLARDGKVYNRLDGSQWMQHELETDLYKSWLNESQRTVFDLVLFAAPSLEIVSVKSDELVRIQLGKSDEPNDPQSFAAFQPTHPSSGWQKNVTFDSIEGEVSLHSDNGIWSEATLKLKFHYSDVDGDLLRGKAELQASLNFLASSASFLDDPPKAKPVPVRKRPEHMRKKLLDGLIGQ